MSFVRKAALWGFRIVVGLVVLIATLWTLVVFFPGVLVNSQTLVWAQGLLRHQGVDIDWEEASFAFRAPTLLQRRVSFTSKGLSFATQAGSIRAKTSEFSFQVVLDFSYLVPRLSKIEALDIVGKSLTIFSAPSSGKSSPEKDSHTGGFIPSVPWWLASVQLRRARVSLEHWEVIGAEEPLKGDIAVFGHGEPGHSNWTAKAHFSGAGVSSSELVLSAESARSVWKGPWVIRAEAKGRLKGQGAFHASIRGVPKSEDLVRYVATLGHTQGRQRTRAKLEGMLRTQSLSTRIDVTADNLVEQLPRVSAQRCEFKWSWNGDQSIDFRCPMVAALQVPVLDRRGLSDPAKQVALLLASHVDIHGKDEKLSGEIAVTASSLLREIKEGKAALKVGVEGSLKDLPSDVRFNSQLSVEVEKFEKVVKLLSEKAWAIPEPFASLKGAVKLTAQGNSQGFASDKVFPWELSTGLRGSSQNFVTISRGQVRIGSQEKGSLVHIEAEAELAEVDLTLPYLSLESQPQLLPDSRITKKEPSSDNEERSKVVYHLHVSNPKNRPVHLYSNLAKAPIPIFIDLDIDSEKGNRGVIRVSEFPLQLFRQNAFLRRVDIHLESPLPKSEIGGEVEVVYADYTIRLKVMGPLNKPRFHIESDPPMPEKKLLAALLYGRPVEQLSAEEAESVGSAGAALAEGAVNLASMYLLASTPIESIQYNASDQSFTARLKIDSNTSVTLGTRSDKAARVGIRRRLGSNFSIHSYLEKSYEASERSFATFLEWAKRY